VIENGVDHRCAVVRNDQLAEEAPQHLPEAAGEGLGLHDARYEKLRQQVAARSIGPATSCGKKAT